MKKLFMLFAGVFLYADISAIISQIKDIDSYTPVFKPVRSYSVFTDISLKKQHIKADYTGSVLVLNAVFQDRADINGKWVKKGDKIEGYEVLRVNSDKVVLKKDGKIKILSSKSKVLK
jgi:type II secretory pathway component PulC